MNPFDTQLRGAITGTTLEPAVDAAQSAAPSFDTQLRAAITGGTPEPATSDAPAPAAGSGFDQGARSGSRPEPARPSMDAWMRATRAQRRRDIADDAASR